MRGHSGAAEIEGTRTSIVFTVHLQNNCGNSLTSETREFTLRSHNWGDTIKIGNCQEKRVPSFDIRTVLRGYCKVCTMCVTYVPSQCLFCMCLKNPRSLL